MRPLFRRPFLHLGIALLIPVIYVIKFLVWTWWGLVALADGLLLGDWEFWHHVNEEMKWKPPNRGGDGG